MEHKIKNLLRRSKNSSSPEEQNRPLTQNRDTPDTQSAVLHSAGQNIRKNDSNARVSDHSASNHEREVTDHATANEYQPTLSTTAIDNPSHELSKELSNMSFSGDSRLTTIASKYQEDVADRNIAKWGRGSQFSRHSSLDAGDESAQRDFIGTLSFKSLDPEKRRDSLPAAEQAIPASHSSRQDCPVENTHEEQDLSEPIDQSSVFSVVEKDGLASGMRRDNLRHKPSMPDTGHLDLRKAFVDRSSQYSSPSAKEEKPQRDLRGPSLDGIVDLQDSIDVDKTTRVAPAVTHEVVKPHEHEIIEERIYREIHNYEVYHYVLPVRETEVLPARHFVPDPDGGRLIEVPRSRFPGWAERNPMWLPTKKEEAVPKVARTPRELTEPKIISDETYTTPEGYPRRETTWLHPATLADLSGYGGPIVPMQFFHHSEEAKAVRRKAVPESLIQAVR